MTLLSPTVVPLSANRPAKRACGPMPTLLSWYNGNVPKPGIAYAPLWPRVTVAYSVAPTLATLPFTVREPHTVPTSTVLKPPAVNSAKEPYPTARNVAV